MKKSTILFLSATLLSGSAFAQAEPAALTVSSTSIANGRPIATQYAYCMQDGADKTRDGGNISPQISWTAGPANTKSYALLLVDPDVPASFELANQAGKIIPENFARQDFYHWVLYNIPANVLSIDEGADSKKVIAGGKPIGSKPYGIDGKNDYAKMSGGITGGYDGPCPPWNDERLHHYHIDVYALDVPSLNLVDSTGPDVAAAIKDHVIAKGEIVGTFSNNSKAGAQ